MTVEEAALMGGFGSAVMELLEENNLHEVRVLRMGWPDKLIEHGGESALLDPHVNIQVGAQILREYLRRFGETETALQMYAGAFDEPNSSYAFKVLAERARLEQMLKQLRRPASA